MKEDPRYREARHPIRVVSERTGLSPDVLRAWERRHAVVAPARSEGGQRLYSDADIDHLTLLLKATEAGRSVGQVANLPLEELERLVAEDAEQLAVRPTPAGDYRERALAAVRALDPARLRAVLRAALLSLGVPAFLDDVLAPTMILIGEGWSAGTIGIGHEHAASAVARAELSWLLHRFEATDDAPCVVVATVVGERHELGAMLAAVAAAHDGWRVVYLGPDLPAPDIAVAARSHGAAVVGVSSLTGDPDRVMEELRALRQQLAPGTALVAGGAATPTLDSPEGGITVLRDLAHWRRVLRSHAPARFALAGENRPR